MRRAWQTSGLRPDGAPAQIKCVGTVPQDRLSSLLFVGMNTREQASIWCLKRSWRQFTGCKWSSCPEAALPLREPCPRYTATRAQHTGRSTMWFKSERQHVLHAS